MNKTLRRLDNQGDLTTIAEIPIEVKALTANGDKLYLTAPVGGKIYCFDKELKVFVTGLPDIHGIHCVENTLYCESSERYFFGLNLLDKMTFALVGARGKKDIGSIKADSKSPHPRINGIHYDSIHSRLFFAYPERHTIYSVGNDSLVNTILGNGRQGFSIGSNGSGSLSYPSDVVAQGNRLFVSDTANHVIREYILDNEIKNGRLIGSPLSAGTVDEIGSKSKLCQPTDMASVGNILFFVDSYRLIRSVLLNNLMVNTLYESPSRIEAIAAAKNGSVFFIESDA
jgi:hypothetical protein